MKPYYEKDGIIIYHGDCPEVMRGMEASSVDTIITDPPYALEFMGKGWDKVLPPVKTWVEALRVAKPGAMLMAFGGTRTYHRLACVIEDAGWEIRDCIRYEESFQTKYGPLLDSLSGDQLRVALEMLNDLTGVGVNAWVYGSGFPKSHDISKGIDKAAVVPCPDCHATGKTRNPKAEEWEDYWLEAPCSRCKGTGKVVGAERKVVGISSVTGSRSSAFAEERADSPSGVYGEATVNQVTAPATTESQTWDGYGTALKPAWEPIVLAMKPLDGTFAQNALKWGVAGLWIDGGRIGTEEETGRDNKLGSYASERTWSTSKTPGQDSTGHGKGRWPANLIHDGSEEVMEEFAKAGDRKAGAALTGHEPSRTGGKDTVAYGEFKERREWISYQDDGSAARFFYCAKASKAERNKGCGDMDDKVLARSCQAIAEAKRGNAVDESDGAFNKARIVKNNHPTVKPISLMHYLCRLTRMPEGGTVLDPFMGSGSTGIAAKLEGREFIGIEREAEYCEIAKNRIEAWEPEEVEADDQKEFGF